MTDSMVSVLNNYYLKEIHIDGCHGGKGGDGGGGFRSDSRFM